jgi:cellulose biosynthesis protein BcsQ
MYIAPAERAPEIFVQSIRKTELPGLHIVTSCSDLCNADAGDVFKLKSTLSVCNLERFYDYILIDNAPGLDRLQAAALHASNEIFVPTELKQFAVDGLVEMERTLTARNPEGCRISRIIPNFYRNTQRHIAFIAALNKLFPGRVTATAIPVDPVFDEVVTSGKILFLHRLYSKGAAYYLKIIHELFDLDEDTVWEMVQSKRRERISEEARQRFYQQQEDGGKDEK